MYSFFIDDPPSYEDALKLPALTDIEIPSPNTNSQTNITGQEPREGLVVRGESSNTAIHI